MKLSEEIRDEIDGGEECRGRDSQLTEWCEMAHRLENQVLAVKNWDERDSKSIDYYTTLRLDPEETRSFIEKTYYNFMEEEIPMEWEDFLDDAMEKFIVVKA